MAVLMLAKNGLVWVERACNIVGRLPDRGLNLAQAPAEFPRFTKTRIANPYIVESYQFPHFWSFHAIF